MDALELTAVAAANIRAALSARGMTQRRLAAEADLHEPNVSVLLRAAKATPTEAVTLVTLAKVAGALGMTVAELLTPERPARGEVTTLAAPKPRAMGKRK